VCRLRVYPIRYYPRIVGNSLILSAFHSLALHYRDGFRNPIRSAASHKIFGHLLLLPRSPFRISLTQQFKAAPPEKSLFSPLQKYEARHDFFDDRDVLHAQRRHQNSNARSSSNVNRESNGRRPGNDGA
jgi:hypothetical protein